MSKRKLNRRQAWRIQKIQDERTERAKKRDAKSEATLDESGLGPEQQGRIIAHYGKLIVVESIDKDRQGEHKRCHFRSNLGSLVTGDNVIWRDSDPYGVIVAVEPRQSELLRPDPYGAMKAVAANIGRIVIVVAPYPEPHANLIDRYLVAAETVDIEPVVLINKMDRVNDSNRDKIHYLRQLYLDLGYQVLEVSTQNHQGMDNLKHFLAEHTSVFVGQSGVGKSSLVNGLLPDIDAKVGALSEATQKGTHTTTTAHLYHFPDGGHLIDSPGIREFGLWHMTPEEVIAGFKDIRPYIGHCKFRDCAHATEPGCAILAAVDDGHISPARFDSYLNILDSLNDH